MQAKETKLQDIIEGTKQYVIPLFQRTYSWTSKEWEVLWKDLVELCESDNPKTHFIGSIVNMPTVSVPEGVAKYLLIDGQQRLTTIFILLALLRNKAREIQNQGFADEINNTLLVNPYKKGNDYYKLMPTQVDRNAFNQLIDGTQPANASTQISLAYSYFEKKLRQNILEPDLLKKIITTYFSVVSIVLDSDDNPYLVFESLNAKGRPLTQADLIRNYFFMRIHVDEQDDVYSELWEPMQTALGDKLTEYIRHYLMMDGSLIKQGDVYYSLKENISPTNAISYLTELSKSSKDYQRIVFPEHESDSDLKNYFTRLNRIEATTSYPLLLNIYDAYHKKIISKDEFVEILRTLENYLIRRFVCGVPTNQLNKIFPSVYPQILAKYPDDIVKGFKTILQSRGYPKDSEFSQRLKDGKLYGAGDRQVKTKLILESLEASFSHKELVDLDKLTIEHVMPQTLSEWWQNHLGLKWQETHELYLHTIGNLSLTAYNSELSNDDFETKKKLYNASHVELNNYFEPILKWNEDEIDIRANSLAKIALDIWPYFGDENSDLSDTSGSLNKSPSNLIILGQYFKVESWAEVLEKTLNTVADLEPEKFEILAENFPRYISKDKNNFSAWRQLANQYFIEINLSAAGVQKLCNQAMDTIELTSQDWQVIQS